MSSTTTIRHAVVTGSTGHVGNALVRALRARGVPVRVTVRASSDTTPLDGLEGVERADADVSDAAALERAFRGADVVFHVAGLVSITAGQEARLERTNVEGTRNVLDACVAAGVRRLVYTSSVHALTEPAPGGVLDERAGFDPTLAYGAYGKSKARASQLVQRAARDGRLDAVLVLPTGCIGPYDFKLSELGQLVSMAGRGVVPVIVGGGYHFVDVRDVAEGSILAAERAPAGEAYLVDGGHMTTMEMCRAIAAHAGVRPPRYALPLPVVQPLAVLGLLYEKTTGRRALLTPYSIHTLAARYTISADKARRELGFSPRPLERSLADAWTWLSTDPRSPLKRGKTTAKPARL